MGNRVIIKPITQAWDRKELVYPWDDSGYSRDRLGDMENVYLHLSKLGYNVQQYKKKPEDSRLIRTSKMVMESFDESGWVLLCSNSSVFLLSFTNLFPIIYALSTTRSVITIDNQVLAKMTNFKQEEGSEEEVDKIKNSSLIIFNNFCDPSRKLRGQTSDISPIFTSRLHSTKKILMVVSYSYSGADQGLKDLMDKVEFTYGIVVRNLVEEKSKFVHIKTDNIRTGWNNTIV